VSVRSGTEAVNAEGAEFSLPPWSKLLGTKITEAPPAAKGRPLIEGNTHQSGTHSAQSGACVPQGLAGVWQAGCRLAAMHPGREPYALMSTCRGLGAGYQATGIVTATGQV
jgi:hypothetical protein